MTAKIRLITLAAAVSAAGMTAACAGPRVGFAWASEPDDTRTYTAADSFQSNGVDTTVEPLGTGSFGVFFSRPLYGNSAEQCTGQHRTNIGLLHNTRLDAWRPAFG